MVLLVIRTLLHVKYSPAGALSPGSPDCAAADTRADRRPRYIYKGYFFLKTLTVSYLLTANNTHTYW